MTVSIHGFALNVEPHENPFGADYAWHEVERETEKAYLLKHEMNHRSFGWKTVFKWVAKSACRIDENGDVFAPVWMIPVNNL